MIDPSWMTDTCAECDAEVDVDEPPQCYYTGRHCAGGCDCGTSYVIKCRPCGGSYTRVEDL